MLCHAEDSVEVALEFFKACGAYLQDQNKSGFDRSVQALKRPMLLRFTSAASYRSFCRQMQPSQAHWTLSVSCRPLCRSPVHAGRICWPGCKAKMSLRACSILARMRAVISEGVLEKRTALLIQNFMEQVRCPIASLPCTLSRETSSRVIHVLKLQHCCALWRAECAALSTGRQRWQGSQGQLGEPGIRACAGRLGSD